MQTKLVVSSSPFLRDASVSTRRLMGDVVIALIPTALAAIWFFGAPALALMLVSVVFAVLSELVYEKITHQKTTIDDLSAVVTGLLLAFNLPANAPWWMAAIGSIIAIVLVKQIFGGIGSNFMNPALAARAILFVSWATQMTTYPATRFMLDGVSTATPLNSLGTGSVAGVNLMDLFLGNIPGVLGETCKLALLLGGVYLILRRIVDWKIPVTFIATVFVCYLIKDGAEMALYQILSGGLFLGAFFMATDYATSPVTNPGRVIMGIGCGIFLFVIRAYASYPEGCSFAILLMNVATPLIDKYTMPKPFGEVKQHA